jgi:hypothetical protein
MVPRAPCGALHAVETRVDALYVRAYGLEPCVHFTHLLAHLQQQAEQLGRRLVLCRARGLTNRNAASRVLVQCPQVATEASRN